MRKLTECGLLRKVHHHENPVGQEQGPPSGELLRALRVLDHPGALLCTPVLLELSGAL